MTRPDSAACLLLVAAALAGAACDGKSRDERCDELAEYLEGRQSVLDRSCRESSDCAVVYIRPDTPMATSTTVDDPQLARVQETYRAECERIPAAVGFVDAVCLERTIDEVRFDDPDTVTTVSLGRACVLRGDYTVPDAGDTGDASGADASDGDASDVDGSGDSADGSGDTDGGACVCPTCATETFCHACECVPDTVCGRACAAAEACGALVTLGLGATTGVCAAGCDASVTADPTAYGAFADCLRTSACDAIEDCGRLLP